MISNLNFSDLQNHWAQECIRQLATRNIINGYPDGTFRPNNPVTRAEFAALLRKAFPNLPVVRSAIAFKDIPANHWASAAIQSAYQTGFLSGYPDRTFQPNQPIPRVQALVALVSGLKYDSSSNPGQVLNRYFEDAAAIPSYALKAIATATERRLVVNYPNVKRLNPNQNATRAEVAAFICRASNTPGVPLQYIPGTETFAISPQFTEADSFSNGLARVKLDDKWMYIDPTGKQAIQLQFDEAESFADGLALVKTYQPVKQESIAPQTTRGEIRGVWLTTTASQALNSQSNIAEAMNFLAETGFNVVFPVVWNNAATLYPSRIMRDNFGLEIDPRFTGRDPLKELIVEAKRVGLAVIPWFEYGFASSFSQNGGRILAKKPEWAAKDVSGNLLKKNNFEWMNAFDSEVQDFLRSLVVEVVNNYDIAGIQGDDRLPALPSEGGYDTKTMARYAQQFNQNPPQNAKDAQWLQWRADLLTTFLTRLYQDLIAINPNLIISLSPSVYPWGYQEYLQDAQAWIDQGLADLIHPQLYRRDFAGYKELIDRLVSQQFTPLQLPYLVPGVLLKAGSYRMSPDLLRQTIQYNRDRGINGEVFFFYEGLREDNNALANVLRTGPYAQKVPFNAALIKAQGFTLRRLSGKYSYIDSSGQPMIQPYFDWADSFTEGLANVKMGYKWGYIDKTGKLISRLQFDQANAFSEGFALVKSGNKYGYIDKSGNLVIPLQYDEAESFHEGLAAVRISNVWSYIDPTAKVIFIPQVDQAGSFSEGLARVKLRGKFGYINKTGQTIVPPQVDQAGSFSQGLAPVAVGNKWGYVNSTGQLAIATQFDQAASFSQGLAAVRLAGLWGYIDRRGQIVIPPAFDEAKPFTLSKTPTEDLALALVKVNGKWGYIKPPQ